MDSAPKIKRKKRIDPCQNPLFVKWLTEWRDEAAGKGIKTQYAYGKALISMKKYPLPLASGKEAKILDHVGDKICTMLDKKLAIWNAENGSPSMASLNVDTSQPSNTDHVPNLDIGLPTIPPSASASGEAVKEKPKRKAAVKRVPREYVPVYRSGPYAIIHTLYRNHIKLGSRGYMSKSELQREAQPHCDMSFTLPEPGSHYTAWSSMSTLISKGYIIKKSSPAKYIITDTGCEMALKLEAVEKQYQLNQSTSSPPANGRTPVIGGSSGSDSDAYCRMSQSPERLPAMLSKSAAPHTVSRPPDKLEYWYIDDRGHEVHSKDAAAVIIDDELSIGFLIKCEQAALQQSAMRYKDDTSRSASNSQIYAYLHNDDAPEYCPVPTRTQGFSSTSAMSTGSSSFSKPLSTHTLSSSSQSSTSPSRILPRYQSIGSQNSIASSKLDHQSLDSSYSAKDPMTNANRQTDESRNSLTSVGTVRSQSSTASSVSRMHSDVHVGGLKEPSKLYAMRPGTFEIVLCVDNCEIGGGKQGTRKDLLLPELQKNGVNLDVRKLHVGDFLWIAREKRVPVAGMLQMPDRQELVLDYIVERKRMDDLCGSIMDGRFHEQKFRLKKCGLHKPIYLVEDFGSIDHLSIPAATLRQAAINTQVVNGFFVKHTRNQKESVAYLTIMTRYLQSNYSNKTLEAYLKDDLDTLGKTDTDFSNDIQQLLTFQEFNDCSIKNKETTVFETFAKQLLQFAGLSAEKALAITNVYKTPADLVDAYSACALEKEKEKLLAHVKYGRTQRNLGPTLSKLLYQFYCVDIPLK